MDNLYEVFAHVEHAGQTVAQGRADGVPNKRFTTHNVVSMFTSACGHSPSCTWDTGAWGTAPGRWTGGGAEGAGNCSTQYDSR